MQLIVNIIFFLAKKENKVESIGIEGKVNEIN